MNLTQTLTLTAAAGAGVVGGVLYGFSAFVMRGLDASSPATAVAAMQQVNRFAPRGPLLVPLVGTALLCLLLAVRAVVDLRGGDRGAWWLLAGAALYLVAFVVTAAYHVPRNDALMAVDPDGAGAAAAWQDYATGWTRMNHLRTAASLGAAAALVGSVLR
jgi:uncharacterized membrane protein